MKHNNLSIEKNKIKLCFVVNNVAFFVSHRLPIALEAMKNGYIVHLIVGRPGSISMESAAIKKISKFNISITKLHFSSDGLNPISEVFYFIQIFLELKKINPEIVHCVSPKGVLYGGLATRLLGFPSLIIAISGMGSLFIENKKKLQIKKIYYFLYKYLLKIIFNYKNKTIIVQNNDDKNFILSFKNVLKENIVLIQGSGVDLKLFSEINLEAKEKIVLFPARILKDKGALEFVNAARILKHKFPEWKFIMAGASDYANPSKISTQTIQQWVMDGVIDWLGHKEEMVDIYKKSSVVCLPSYREGMPKSLLEAAAAGCAVITTNAIGCKDAIIPNITGILVPVCDVSSTVLALDKVMRDDKLRKEFGRAGIVLAAKSFSLESVVCKTINVYNHSTIINNMHSDHK